MPVNISLFPTCLPYIFTVYDSSVRSESKTATSVISRIIFLGFSFEPIRIVYEHAHAVVSR